MRKKPIDLLRLTALLLLSLTLVYPTHAYASQPGSGDGPEQTASTELPNDVPNGSFKPAFGYAYTVQPGDDIWLIAIAHDITMDDLAAANGLETPYIIYPDQKLWVPALAADVAEFKQIATAPARSEETAPPAETVRSPAPAIEAAPPPAEAGEWAAIIVNQMNEKRAQFGLHPLAWNGSLAQAAQSHADDLAWRGWGSHTGSDGATLRTRYARIGYYPGYASENWANYSDPYVAFSMWWNEPPGWDPHRQNILGAQFDEVGIGIARGGYGYFFVADFAG